MAPRAARDAHAAPAAHAFSGQVAIAGIGATEFSKASGRSELRLAVEAVTAVPTSRVAESTALRGGSPACTWR